MRRKHGRRKIVYLTLYLCIALLGVSYGGWTGTNTLLSSITTGNMDYDFEGNGNGLFIIRGTGEPQPVKADISMDSGKYLNIKNIDGASIIGISENDRLRITYSLKKKDNTKGNVALKTIDSDIVDVTISLDPNTYVCNYSGTTLTDSDLSKLLPSTLGTFKAHHTFDGTNGTIDLIPRIKSSTPPATIVVKSLTEEEKEKNIQEAAYTIEYFNETLEQMIEEKAAMEEETAINSQTKENNDVVTNAIQDSTEQNTDPASGSNTETSQEVFTPEDEEVLDDLSSDIDTDSDFDEDPDITYSKDKPKTKIQTLIETITLSGSYGFSIPLNFDQYNAD